MEPKFPSISLLLSFFLFIFLLTKQVINSRKNSKKLPPGPWKLPIIGNLHQLSGPLPHRTLSNLSQKYGPLMHLKLGEVSTVIISSADIAKQALKDHDVIFAQRPFSLAGTILSYNSMGMLFSPYSPYLRHLRKICAVELLSLKRVRSFQAIRKEEVFNLVKSISESEGYPVNFSKKVYALSYGIMARAAFGNKCKDHDEFVELIQEVFPLTAGFTFVDMYPSVKAIQWASGMKREIEKLHTRIDFLAQKIVNEHRERNQEVEASNIVGFLLRTQKEGDLEFPLNDDNIKAVIREVFGGGSDTSSTAIEWAMSQMVKNPGIMQKAQAEVRRVFGKSGNADEAHIDELKYLDALFKETLRLHPPAPLLVPKENSEECEINGFQIPAKSKVIVNAWAIGRDPKYWNLPEKFVPERFLESDTDFRGRDFEFIPFGAGRRTCPGISFAVPGVKLALAQLLFHFDWKVANESEVEEVDMEEEFGLTVKRKNDLILIPTLHELSQLKQS